MFDLNWRITMIEKEYLLYSHYKIKANDSSNDIVYRAAKKSYMDFCRRATYQSRVPINLNRKYEEEIEILLSEKIPSLLSLTYHENNQAIFDEEHLKICQSIVNVYENAKGQMFGIAQKWLNLTLLNLVIIDTILDTNDWNIRNCRKYFHIPVDQYVIEAATFRRIGKYKHGLYLKSAPLKHNEPEKYIMDWYSPEKTQPFEKWEYYEYIDFQKAIRSKLREPSFESQYSDPLDWGIHAYLEVYQSKIIY